MPVRLIATLLILSVAAASTAWSAAKKKKKSDEEITQTLDEPKDPPAATAADVGRLTFFVSPLSAKGLLSQQIRDALKNLLSQSRGAQIVRIRAFVAGSGDLRRVPALVSEIFTDKKLSLPAVSVVQVGALPLTGAQVLMEATATEKKVVNPAGLAIIAGHPGTAAEAGSQVTKSLEQIGLRPESVRQVTCFLDSLEFEGSARQQVAAAFPRAAAAFVQLRRDSAGDFAQCQAVAALDKPPAQNPWAKADTVSLGPVRVALTGTQMGFGREEKDIRLALDRLGKALESAGASWKTLAATDTYVLSRAIAAKVGPVREQFAAAQPSAPNTMLVFEGLPSVDASFAIEATAVVERAAP